MVLRFVSSPAVLGYHASRYDTWYCVSGSRISWHYGTHEGRARGSAQYRTSGDSDQLTIRTLTRRRAAVRRHLLGHPVVAAAMARGQRHPRALGEPAAVRLRQRAGAAAPVASARAVDASPGRADRPRSRERLVQHRLHSRRARRRGGARAAVVLSLAGVGGAAGLADSARAAARHRLVDLVARDRRCARDPVGPGTRRAVAAGS